MPLAPLTIPTVPSSTNHKSKIARRFQCRKGYTCKLLQCTKCQKEKQRKALDHYLPLLKNANQNQVRSLVLTISTADTPALDQFDVIETVWSNRAFEKWRERNLEGFLRFWGVTYSWHGFHVHLHLIVVYPDNADADKRSGRLFELWCKYVEQAGGRADEHAQWIKSYRDPAGELRYVAGQHLAQSVAPNVTPEGVTALDLARLARSGSEDAADLLDELAAALSGRRVSSGGILRPASEPVPTLDRSDADPSTWLITPAELNEINHSIEDDPLVLEILTDQRFQRARVLGYYPDGISSDEFSDLIDAYADEQAEQTPQMDYDPYASWLDHRGIRSGRPRTAGLSPVDDIPAPDA